MTLTLKPISLRNAAAFVLQHHSHHRPPQGAKFAVSAWMGDQLVAVAVVGRPVARREDDGFTAEITRVCTDRTPNAASFIITRAKRAAQAMGYVRVLTRTLSTETGVSLTACGWKATGETDGGSWSRDSRPRSDKHPTGKKTRWTSPRLGAA